MNANEILRKYEDANEMHFHEVDRKWIIQAMDEYVALHQPSVIGSVCDFCKGEGSMWDGEFRDCYACKGSGKQTDL